MNLKKIFLITTLLFFGSLTAYYFDTRVEVSPIVGSHFIANIDVNQIQSLQLINSKNETTLLDKQGNHFFLVSSKNFPAENEKINEFLETVLDIKIGKWIEGAGSKNYDYGLAPDKAKLQVKILDSTKKILSDFSVGNEVQDKGNYLLDNVSGRVYLSERPVYLTVSAENFYNKKILPVSNGDVIEITKLSPELGKIKLNENNWLDLNNNKVEEADAMKLVSEFTALQFNNFYLEDEESSKKLSFPYTIELKSKDDVTFQFNLGSDGKKAFAKIKAISPEVGNQIVITDKTDAKTISQIGNTLQAKQKGDTFNALKSPWIFELSQSFFEMIQKNFPQSNGAKVKESNK